MFSDIIDPIIHLIFCYYNILLIIRTLRHDYAINKRYFYIATRYPPLPVFLQYEEYRKYYAKMLEIKISLHMK